MADQQIVIEIVLDDGTTKEVLGKIKKESEDTAKAVENSFDKSDKSGGVFNKKLGDISVGFAAVAAVAVKAFSLVADEISKSVDEAIESERATNALSAALANQGKFSSGAVENFNNFADSLERTTGVQADVIVQNAALLSSLGNLSGAGLERATQAAIDFGAATGKDLGTTSRLLSQAALGNTEALRRYGIVIDESIPKSQRFEAALKQIEERFGGRSAQNLNTFEGAIANLGNGVNKVREVFGNLIVLSPSLREIIKFIADGFFSIGESLGKTFGGRDVLKPFFLGIIDLGIYVTKNLGPAFELFFNLVKTGFFTITSVASLIGIAIANVFNFIQSTIIIPFVDRVGQVVIGLTAFFSEETATKLDSIRLKSLQVGKDISQGLLDGTEGAFKASSDALVTSANNVLDTGFSEASAKTLEILRNRVAEAQNIPSNINNGTPPDAGGEATIPDAVNVAQAFSATLEGAEARLKQLAIGAKVSFGEVGKAAVDGIGRGVGGAFAAFGRAVAKGENALDAFAQAFLASVGQTAIQLGTNFILAGIGYSFLGDPRGPGLITAGAALAAFGGVLSAVGGGAASSADTNVGGGFTSSDTSSGLPLGETTEPAGPTNAINLTIQGDVLDSDSTSLRIVELLNTYTDKNGTNVLVTA